MNQIDFQVTIKPLIEKYGNTTFDPHKLAMIYDACQDLPTFQFKMIVDDFVGEDVRAKVSDFKAKAEKFKSKRIPQSDGKCKLCNGNYWIEPDDWDPRPRHLMPMMYCICVGGVDKLVEIVKSGNTPNFELAERIERTWHGIESSEWKRRGGEIADQRQWFKRSEQESEDSENGYY